ncbi:hypothetical protein PVAND_012582 [Polypedilum vanderplanki]|uniref:Odorant receptor n=1 Tax=Polypedilum vanderplanki TaxID=319348 RepID=A0A9J6CNV8_POLVA|nr:hypothetical protein PVAND_012582 [Polypedilum vanderplanki]
MKLIQRRIWFWYDAISILVFTTLTLIDALFSSCEVDHFSFSLACFLSGSKHFFSALFLQIHRERISKVLDLLRQSYPTRDDYVRTVCKRFRILSIVVVVFIISLNIVACAVPLLTLCFSGQRTFILPYPDFFKRNEIYPFALIWSFYNSTIGVTQVISLTYVFVAIAVLISLEFDELKAQVGDWKNCDEKEVDERIRDWVKQHNRAFDIVNEFDKAFSIVFLIKFVISATNIAMILFHLRAQNDFGHFIVNIAYVTSELNQIFLQCYIGQLLMNSSEQIIDSLYDCGWENWENLKLKKTILIIMQRSQKPAVLTIGKFGTVSVQQFTDVS